MLVAGGGGLTSVASTWVRRVPLLALLAFAVGGAGVAGAAGLPDGRLYERVTPAHKNGALISSLPYRHPPAVLSEDGRRVIAPSTQCFGDPESCTGYRLTEADPYDFERTGGGWVTRGLAPPAGVGEAASVWTVDANTGTALFSAAGSADGPDDFLARFAPEGAADSLVEIGPFGEANEAPSRSSPTRRTSLLQAYSRRRI